MLSFQAVEPFVGPMLDSSLFAYDFCQLRRLDISIHGTAVVSTKGSISSKFSRDVPHEALRAPISPPYCSFKYSW